MSMNKSTIVKESLMEKTSESYVPATVKAADAVEVLAERAQQEIEQHRFRKWLGERFAEIESKGEVVGDLYVHPKTYHVLQDANKHDFDPVTRRALRATGYMGDLWGAAVRLDSEMPEGVVRLVAWEEKVEERA